jgi:uncharacterized protein
MSNSTADFDLRSDVSRQLTSTIGTPSEVDPSLLERMMEPAFYPHQPQTVEPLQTLTAWLLFVGEFVYKVKKPVHFSFVDARTPARRYRLCRDEVLLNRRFAPEVYLGVTGITQGAHGFELVPNAALNGVGLLEFAIVMHRLPRERMLSHLASSQTIAVSEIQQLAEKLAEVHLKCAIAKSRTWGSAAAISRLLAVIIADAGEFIADTVMRERLAMTARYLRGYVISHQRLLDGRARIGRVRECHGDLCADSVCLGPPAPAIISGVEYREQMRYGDVASELASLVIDLEMAGRNDIADALVQSYVSASNDRQIRELIPFYKCYRAVRRGHSEMLVSLQSEMAHERRMVARHRASEWFQLAERTAATTPE